MSIQVAAQAALSYWPTGDAITAVAISGSETGGSYDPAIGGDSPNELVPYGVPTWQSRPYACPQTDTGFTSWGLWQVNLMAHSQLVASLSGLSPQDPCGLAGWLQDPNNNAQAAHAVWAGVGGSWEPWTTYRDGGYTAYLPAAQTAIGNASLFVPPPYLGTRTTSEGALIAGAVGVGLLGVGLLGVGRITGHLRHLRASGG